MKFIKYLLLLIVVVFLKLFGWLFKGTRKTVDLGVDAYQSVRNSKNLDEAYRNFASNKYAKARLGIPEAIIALMAKVAASDGKISELEIEYMSDTILSMTQAMVSAGVDQRIVTAIKQKLFRLANRAKKDHNPVSYYCHTLSKASLEIRQGAFLQIIAFASLDGLSDNTLTMIYQIGENLHFSAAQTDAFFERVNGQTGGATYQKDPYEVLGCDQADDFAKIKKIYRKKVKQYHPDFMHGKGMADAQIQEATEQMQEINAAFEEIKRRRAT